MLVSFSGIDCCGKSTQIQMVKKRLEEQERRVKVIWSRGGYTPLVEFFKLFVARKKNTTREEKIAYSQQVTADGRKAKILLFVSILDLAMYYGLYVRVLSWFEVVLCDRYFWDSYIDFYMRYRSIDFKKWCIWKFACFFVPKPKVSIMMYIDADESMRRSELKFEPFPEDVETRRERINNYFSEMKKGHWQNCIDASVSIELVNREIMQCINAGNH